MVSDETFTPLESFANSLLSRWMTPEQVAREADADLSGEIEWDEFEDLCKGTLRLKLSSKEMREVFDFVDADGSGSISPEELQTAISGAMKTSEAKMMAGVAQARAMEQMNAESLVPALPGGGEVGEAPPPAPDTKLIALVAHNNMKPAMMAFVAKHRNFFKNVCIVTTGSTGAALEKKLGLSIAVKVASGPLGGDQEIGGMITRDEVAAAFFFIDPLSSHPHEADIRALTRICDVHNCAAATNPSTGEALVHAFVTCPTASFLLDKAQKREESAAVEEYKKGQTAVIAAVAAR